MNLETDKLLYVLTGEVVTGCNNEILKSSAIGSCIVVVAFDIINHIGGMAHILLYGVAPSNTSYKKTRYAQNAISELITKMIRLGAKNENIEYCIVGGANVLKKENDTIAQNNVDGILDLLNQQNYILKAKSVGGTKRRSATFNIKTGILYITVGNEAEKTLWKFSNLIKKA